MKRRIPIRISQPRRSKFGVRNDKIGKLARTVDGILFASQREANRYCELRLLGAQFRMQVRFPLFVQEKHIGNYIADFVIGEADGKTRVEDVKGFQTPLYRWKKKHFEAQYGITITEI